MKKETKKTEESFMSRPPVVVILGHVDHGKTSILDYIRKTKVVEKESGGITQHIGAYEIEHQGKKITFVDTPGHEAFSAMRSRGTRIADIAILVVAAEEGVKPQAKEAISHIKKSGIPMIVAINKIDKPEANPEKIKRELAQQDVLTESMSGKVPSINVSAKTGQGINELLELILLVAEMEGLKGDTSEFPEGAVIEAYLDSRRGPTATLLLRKGVLRVGDIVGTPSALGKLKILENFQGESLQMALFSMPVVVLGLEKVPQVGEKFKVFSDIENAQKYIEKKERKTNSREVFLVTPEKRVLNLILKADVLGSLEAIDEILKDIPQEKVVLRVLKTEVGEIIESDVKLAEAAKARIVGFRVKINSRAVSFAERGKIKILTFDVIYELVQGIRQLMENIVAPEVVRQDLGRVKILAVFLTEKNRQVVGGRVVGGEVKKGVRIEVLRNEEKVGEGKLINLQKNKKDAQIAIKGDECGMLYEGDTRIEEGDTLQIYVEERKKGEL